MRGSPQGRSQSSTPLKRPSAEALLRAAAGRDGRKSMSQGSQECVDALRCECGSTELCIAYRTPVFAYLRDGTVVRAVVPDDQELVLGGVVRCLVCDRFWILDEKPDLGTWPVWELDR
jgi:hypothetical protein